MERRGMEETRRLRSPVHPPAPFHTHALLGLLGACWGPAGGLRHLAGWQLGAGVGSLLPIYTLPPIHPSTHPLLPTHPLTRPASSITQVAGNHGRQRRRRPELPGAAAQRTGA